MAKVAFLIDDLFEDSELRVPLDHLSEAGHEIILIGREADQKVVGKRGKERLTTDRAAHEVSADELDAVVIPGGYAPDKLRTDSNMVALTRDMFDAGKPVAAVCHAGWMLAEADVAKGRTVTSWPSIKTDLINAGAKWVDREVVEDGPLITSRNPDDLEAFSAAILRRLEAQESKATRAPKAVRARGRPVAAYEAKKPGKKASTRSKRAAGGRKRRRA